MINDAKIKKVEYIPVNTLSQILDELRANTWISRRNQPMPGVNYGALGNLNVTLLPEQMNFIKNYLTTTWALGLRGLMLAADPGTGKTIASLGLKEILNPKRVLIIAPLPAVNLVWVDTIKLRYRQPRKVWTSLMPPEKLTEDTEFIIIHYDYLSKIKPLLSIFGRILSNTMVILDEAHNLNNMKSNRTVQYLELCLDTLKSKYIVSLTGTPIKAESVEVIPLIRATDPLFTPRVEQSFKKLFGGETNKATAILRHRVTLIQYRVIKDLGPVKP